MIDSTVAWMRVKIEGLDNLASFKGSATTVRKKAKSAITKTIKHARAKTSDQIRREVRFTSDYLVGANGKLALISQRDKLEAKITASPRQSSLSKFMVGHRKTGANRGVTVEITPGRRITLRRAFLMKLKQTNRWAHIDGRLNAAVMMRVKPNELSKFKKSTWKVEVVNGKKPLQAFYGPSVGQTFANVIEQNERYFAKYLEREFTRLMKLEDR